VSKGGAIALTSALARQWFGAQKGVPGATVTTDPDSGYDGDAVGAVGDIDTGACTAATGVVSKLRKQPHPSAGDATVMMSLPLSSHLDDTVAV